MKSYPNLAQDFCFSSRRENGRIASYATVFTTLKRDKKIRKALAILRLSYKLESDIIKFSLLNPNNLRKYVWQ